MKRSQRREHIAPFIIHSKALEKKSLVEEVLGDGSIKFYVRGFASTITKDGSGDIVMPDGIKTQRYLANPIIKIGHKRGEENNVGLTTQLSILPDGMYIEAEVVLNDSIQMHKSIIHGLRHGLIKGFSIGFGDVQYHYDREKDANIITSLELYEISLVDIPDNPLTVVKALQFYKEKIEKAAVPFRSYDLMDEGAEWSGSTAEGTVRKRASSDGSGHEDTMDRGKYKNGFAWYDSENPEGFGGYKLGHHQVVDGTMQTNWRGTAAAMAALFGARGGVNLPDADRQAVYNHLAKHYKEFDKEVPAFKSLQDKQMDKQKFLHQFEGKILGKSDISIGKIVEYKRMDFGGNEIDLYPGNHYFVGKIIDIMTSGTILMYSDAMNATPEDPIITLQDHIVINGQLVMTGNYCVDRFSSLWIEKEYSASKSYVAMYMKDAEDNIHSSGEEDDKEGEIENQEPEGGDTPPEGGEHTDGGDTADIEPENGTQSEKGLIQKTLLAKDFESYKSETSETIKTLEENLCAIVEKQFERIADLEKSQAKIVAYMKSKVTGAPLLYEQKKEENSNTQLGQIIKQLKSE